MGRERKAHSRDPQNTEGRWLCFLWDIESTNTTRCGWLLRCYKSSSEGAMSALEESCGQTEWAEFTRAGQGHWGYRQQGMSEGPVRRSDTQSLSKCVCVWIFLNAFREEGYIREQHKVKLNSVFSQFHWSSHKVERLCPKIVVIYFMSVLLHLICITGNGRMTNFLFHNFIS